MKWLAYCAPGRKIESAIALAIEGKMVSEITESPVLAGRTDVILVNPDALEWFPEPLPIKLPPIWGHGA